MTTTDYVVFVLIGICLVPIIAFVIGAIRHEWDKFQWGISPNRR